MRMFANVPMPIVASYARSAARRRRQHTPPRSLHRCRRRRQTGHKFYQILPPNRCVVMREMPVRVLTVGGQHVGAVRDLLKGPFDRAERRRVGGSAKSSTLLISSTCALIFGRSASGL